MQRSRWIGVKEAAEILDIDENTVRKRCDNHQLPYRRDEHQHRIFDEALIRQIAAGEPPPSTSTSTASTSECEPADEPMDCGEAAAPTAASEEPPPLAKVEPLPPAKVLRLPPAKVKPLPPPAVANEAQREALAVFLDDSEVQEGWRRVARNQAAVAERESEIALRRAEARLEAVERCNAKRRRAARIEELVERHTAAAEPALQPFVEPALHRRLQLLRDENDDDDVRLAVGDAQAVARRALDRHRLIEALSVGMRQEATAAGAAPAAAQRVEGEIRRFLSSLDSGILDGPIWRRWALVAITNRILGGPEPAKPRVRGSMGVARDVDPGE